jgi:hypothetical protein
VGEAWPPRTSEGGGPTADAARPPLIVLRLRFSVFFPFGWWACCSGAAAVGPAWWWLSWCGGVCVLCALSALGRVNCFDACICVVVKAGAVGVFCLRCWLGL